MRAGDSDKYNKIQNKYKYKIQEHCSQCQWCELVRAGDSDQGGFPHTQTLAQHDDDDQHHEPDDAGDDQNRDHYDGDDDNDDNDDDDTISSPSWEPPTHKHTWTRGVTPFVRKIKISIWFYFSGHTQIISDVTQCY